VIKMDHNKSELNLRSVRDQVDHRINKLDLDSK